MSVDEPGQKTGTDDAGIWLNRASEVSEALRCGSARTIRRFGPLDGHQSTGCRSFGSKRLVVGRVSPLEVREFPVPASFDVDEVIVCLR
jgi:hypothetical protein